ncbi:stage II sporulation protein R [Sporosarcina cascadiensis]|uniref:stage II sporulation protein R n=1 Tax=Sporosarcina cascadiensis TaxID=2660747 RepID=UPI00129BD5C5|nr:stage II sporulation protein R [Sporosarcina cascadiensis]
MLQDYTIEKPQTKTSKVLAIIEFILVLLAIQGVLILFYQPAETSEMPQFRILANSNTVEDQQMKQQIQQEIAPLLASAVNESGTPEQMQRRMEAASAEITQLAAHQANGLSVTFEHQAALIPPKRIGFAIQKQDVYDSYILKIGKGKGDNWWCGLFPNVCYPEETAAVETDEEPVTFFIWEWIKSIFS